MAGINLSTQLDSGAKKKKSSLDKGFVFAIVLMVVVLGVWGGIRYFLFATDKEIAALDAQITDSKNALENEKVDRLLSFDNRREGIEKNAVDNVDVAERFQELESLIIPSVRLTQYTFDHNTGDTVISGVTSDYKYLAQQLISLKKQTEYESMRVDKLVTTESGGISFTLKSETLSQ